MRSPSPEARPRPRYRLPAAALALVLLAAGCGPSDRAIAKAREQYAASPDGFVVWQEPLPREPLPGAATASDRGPRLRQDVELAMAVRRQASAGEATEGLPGITLDVEQVDAGGRSRRRWHVWVDTAGLAPGREIRTKEVLEVVDYAPGDSFRVEVRHDIPEAERVKFYREWGEQEPGAGQTP